MKKHIVLTALKFFVGMLSFLMLTGGLAYAAEDKPEKDVTPPVFYGLSDIVTTVGTVPDYYSSVYVTDDSWVKGVNVNAKKVDINTPGAYYITYKATDPYQNKSSAEVMVVVTDQGIYAKEEAIMDLADSVLSTIITEDMSDADKCQAVYQYLNQIPYTGMEYSEDWKQAAYCMLAYRSGDCFSYYSASRLLLERLGYQVLKVVNENGFKHVWCLVSTDHGKTWRHFDPTCWIWNDIRRLCMVTDKKLELYGIDHPIQDSIYSHDWNRDAYPKAE